MKIEIPGYKELDLNYLVLDYNGTIAMGGEIKESCLLSTSAAVLNLKVFA